MRVFGSAIIVLSFFTAFALGASITTGETIFKILEARKIDTAVSLLNRTGMAEYFETYTPGHSFTFLVPTNMAFTKLGDDYLSELISKPLVLAHILKAHILPMVVMSANMTSGLALRSLVDCVKFVKMANSTMVNEAKIIEADILASDGVIHFIDTVIVPPKMKGQNITMMEYGMMRAQKGQNGTMMGSGMMGSGMMGSGMMEYGMMGSQKGQNGTMMGSGMMGPGMMGSGMMGSQKGQNGTMMGSGMMGPGKMEYGMMCNSDYMSPKSKPEPNYRS